MKHLALFVLLLLALPIRVHAAEGDLYRAWIDVTGQREETRDPALLKGFRDVMVKVSGDARLLKDGRLDEQFTPDAVASVSYRDQMAGIPKHDEQGTRDRPFELTVDYKPDRIAAALAALGSRPWTGERPKILVYLAVEIGISRFVVAGEGEPGELQRQSLEKAARRYGLPVVFPSRAEIAADGLTVESLRAPDLPATEAAEHAAGADAVLVGNMVFSDELFGWIADWRLAADGRMHRWGIKGVNFDEAFRHAVRGGAQILSGNGEPD